MDKQKATEEAMRRCRAQRVNIYVAYHGALIQQDWRDRYIACYSIDIPSAANVVGVAQWNGREAVWVDGDPEATERETQRRRARNAMVTGGRRRGNRGGYARGNTVKGDIDPMW